MESVPFDRFLQALAERDIYPDPSDIQDHDVEAIWADIPVETRHAYLRDLGLPVDDAAEPTLDGGDVVFGPVPDAPATPDHDHEVSDGPALEAARALEAVDPDVIEAVLAGETAHEDAFDPAHAETITEDAPTTDAEAAVETTPAEPDSLEAESLPEPDRIEPLDGDDPVDIQNAEALETIEPVEVVEDDEIEELEHDALEEIGVAETAEAAEVDEDSVSEVEVYPVYEPYGYVRISYDEDDHQYLYEVIEPELSEREAKILDFVQETIIDVIDVGLSRLTEEEAEEMLVDLTNEVISDYSIDIDENTRMRLTYYVVRDFLGYGKLDIVMRDPMIEDISCDGTGIPIFLYHRKYESMASTVVFEEATELDSFVIKLAQRSGKHISIADPLLDARLPDGSRLNATLSDEVTTSGSTFTIRKFRDEPFTPPDLIRFGTMSSEMLAYYWMAIQHGASMIVAGGTASGKTTMLNAVLLFIPPQMKIVSIEDTRELNLPHPNWIPGTTRSGFGPRDEKGRQSGEIDMFQLLKAALRQRPEYITVGEVRGAEATVLFQAMATGHAAYGTMHADSVTSVIHRLEGEPINIPRPLLEALDVVSIQIQTRIGGQRVRRTKEIVEIVGMDPNTKELLTNEVFSWDPADDTFEPSGISYVLERIQKEENLSRPELEQEIDNRTLIIRWMKEKGVRDYVDVAKVVQAYYNEPEKLMQTIRVDLGLAEGEGTEISVLDEVLEEDAAEDEEDGFDPTAEIPTPEDASAVSPLEAEDLDKLEGVGDFDPVEAAYEDQGDEDGASQTAAPTAEMDEAPTVEDLEARLDDIATDESAAPDGQPPVDADASPAEAEVEPLEPDPVDPELVDGSPLDRDAAAPDMDPSDEPSELDELDTAEPELVDDDPLDGDATGPGPEPSGEPSELDEPDTAGPEPLDRELLDETLGADAGVPPASDPEDGAPEERRSGVLDPRREEDPDETDADRDTETPADPDADGDAETDAGTDAETETETDAEDEET